MTHPPMTLLHLKTASPPHQNALKPTHTAKNTPKQ